MQDEMAQISGGPRRRCLAIILAAGEGTRMKSALPKVLHEVGGRSMLAHVLGAVRAAGADDLAVVIGPGRDDVAKVVEEAWPGAPVFVQGERLGTAHAVLAARTVIERGFDDVVIAFADTPLVSAATFVRLREPLARGAALAVLGFEATEPTGYGRLVKDGYRLRAIREEKDASEAERAIRLCNAGLMAFHGERALGLLDAIGNCNSKGEYYLTDAVELATSAGAEAATVLAPEDEVMGVNDRRQLAAAEAVFQRFCREEAMREGITLRAPETVFFSADTVLAPDVVVEPHVVFGPGVRVASGARIRAFSHLEGATVAAGAIVGPYARLRPGAAIGEGAHVGNFVEVKNATLGPGAKANHLTYLGDATVGARTNIGAGTITCNYDGYGKHRTTIGDDAFIGVGAALIAPVTVGAGAYVATGSVITDDVPPDALALARARQVNKDGRAVTLRERLKAGS